MEATMSTPGPVFTYVPAVYRVAFLLIEPVFALSGAVMAWFRPLDYLQLTDGASAPPTTESIPLGTNIALAQLANLYLLFAFNEAFVLRSTSESTVWRTVIWGMLIADFGHLYSVSALGPDIYWNVLRWNVMDFGNIGFVYAGACMRIAFLCGIGLGIPPKGSNKNKAALGRKE